MYIFAEYDSFDLRFLCVFLSKTAAKLSSGFMSTLFSTIMVQSVIDMNIIDVNSSLDRIAVVMRNVVLMPLCSAHVVKLMI